MKIFRQSIAASVAFASAVTLLNGAVIVQYNTFNGGDGATTRTVEPQAYTTVAENISASTLAPYRQGAASTVNSINGGVAFTDTYGFVGPNLYRTYSTSGSNSNYFEFTLTASDGYQFDLTSISFAYTTPTLVSGGSVVWDLRSSLDGFATSHASYTSDTSLSSGTTEQFFTSGSITEATVFRIYLYESNNGDVVDAAGRGMISNIVLNGSVAAIPEAGHVAAAIVLALMVPVAGRRFLKRRNS